MLPGVDASMTKLLGDEILTFTDRHLPSRPEPPLTRVYTLSSAKLEPSGLVPVLVIVSVLPSAESWRWTLSSTLPSSVVVESQPLGPAAVQLVVYPEGILYSLPS